VDGYKPGDVVGVYRKDDPAKKLFTPIDALALENPAVKEDGVMGTKGACIVEENGWRSKVTPNTNAPTPGQFIPVPAPN